MILELAPETEAKLVAMAETEQMDPVDLANRILINGLAWAELPEEDEIAAIEEGFRACDEGRVRPFAEYVAERSTKAGTDTR